MIDFPNSWQLGPLAAAFLVTACGQPDPLCSIGQSDTSGFLVQLRPAAEFPEACPQGQQYQLIYAQQYAAYASEEAATVVFQLGGSRVAPPSQAQASGTFTSFRIVPPGDACLIPRMSDAFDDEVVPANGPAPPGSTRYSLSEVEVLSDAVHLGNQFQAQAIVDYGIPGCGPIEYVAQGAFPITPCVDDSICLPDAVATDVPAPDGRGMGSGFSRDSRAFCNLDPALLDDREIASALSNINGIAIGRAASADGTHAVGICFFSEPFPSQCPPGSSLSTEGPCVVGPGSNPPH
jgi:hypothetical protein